MIRALRSSRDFRLLAVGEFVSRAGTAASFIAVWGVAVYELKVSAAVMSLLMLANTLPRIAGSWFAGRVIDRIDPKRAMLLANVVGCGGSLLQFLSDGALQLGLASIVAGFGFGAFLPAIQSMAPRVVDDEHLLPANAVLELTWQVGFLVGPAVGAMVIASAGVRAPLLADAVTFVVAIAWLLPVRLRPKPAREAGRDTGGDPDEDVAGFLNGLRYVWSIGIARFVTVLNTGQWLGVSVFIVLEPIYVARVLEASPATLGYLQTAFGSGAILGSFLATRSEASAGPRLMALTTGISGFGMMSYGGTTSLLAAAVGVAVWGVGMGWTMPVGRTLLQRGVPIHRHGLANGVQSSVQGVGEIIPVLAAGQLAALIGVRTSLVGAGLWTLALATWGAIESVTIRDQGGKLRLPHG